GSLLMAKPKAPRQTLDSYTVKRINKTIKGKKIHSLFFLFFFFCWNLSDGSVLASVSDLAEFFGLLFLAGDCVLMRPSEPSKPSYVAKIEKIEADSRGANVKVHIRWYYRPEESIGGRRQFHGSKELFLSDHYDVQSADTIEGKCTVHTFKSYTKLDAVGNEDYFCRFDYNSTTGAFNPDRVAVYCKCEMPYNPDDLMVQCESCTDWFHPACIEMTAEEAKKLDHFFCESCSSEDQKLPSSQSTSKFAETKILNVACDSRVMHILFWLLVEFHSYLRWIQNDAGGDDSVNIQNTVT
ncbi:Chromatin remodeling protein SHL, partial [Cucurbita argyrosperma subsp. argyrosperma]